MSKFIALVVRYLKGSINRSNAQRIIREAKRMKRRLMDRIPR